MEINCQCGMLRMLNVGMWRSRLYEVAIFLLVLSCCWSEPNTFQAPDRTAEQHKRSNVKPPNTEPNTFTNGNITDNTRNNSVRVVLDAWGPTEPSRQPGTTEGIVTTQRSPEIGGYSPLTTTQQQSYGPACPGKPDWYLYGDHCYYFSALSEAAGKSWEEANRYCMKNGGYLVSIHGNEENNYLKTFIGHSNIKYFWCGLREYEMSSKYRWSDKSPVDFEQWATGEPNDYNGEEQCVQFYIHDGSWNDLNCGDKIPFVCKKPQVTTGQIPATHSPEPSGNCPGSSVRFSNMCYSIHGTEEQGRLGWQEARAKCAEFSSPDGELVSMATIHSQELQSFLNSHLKNLDHTLWIGLSDITNRGQFRWADGTSVDFTHWADGEPNEANGQEDCVEMMTDEDGLGEWNDVVCDKLNGFICQQRPNTDIGEPNVVINDCRKGYTQYHNSCFKVMSKPQSFYTAVDSCNEDGSALANIKDVYEQAFVETLVHSNGEALWIGFTNDEVGPYKWVDGCPVDYTNWGENEPGEDDVEGCVLVQPDGHWDSITCESTYKSVCKYILLDTPASLPQSPGNCDEGWQPYGTHCYQYNNGEDTETSWPEAEFYCNREAAFIASVHSKHENEWIRTTLAAGSNEDIWIGLHRTDSSGFKWQDNTPLGYENWAQNEPTYTWDVEHENCVQMYISNGRWNDADCLQRQSYVCKKVKSFASIKKADAKTSDDHDTKSKASYEAVIPNRQSTQTQMGGMSSGGIIGLVIGTLLLILAGALIIFFVVTHKSSKKASLNLAASGGEDVSGFDNALYRANGDSVQVTDDKSDQQKPNDVTVISDSKTMEA